MNTAAAAQQAGVTVATIRSWCRKNVVTATKASGRWDIDATSLAYRISLSPAKVTDRTGEFSTELTEQLWAAADAYAMAALRDILRLAKARDTNTLAGVPADHVHLTDKQWAGIEREISFQISCLNAEY